MYVNLKIDTICQKFISNIDQPFRERYSLFLYGSFRTG